MADRSFQYIVTAFLIVGVLGVCIFGFIRGMGENYDTETINSDYINFEGLETELNTTGKQSEGWLNATSSDKIQTESGENLLPSIWGTTKLMKNSVVSIYNILFGGIARFLGIPPVVLAMFGAILIVMIILAIRRLIKQGY